MRPRTHVINVQLTVEADERLSNADVLNDLRKLARDLREPQPRRLPGDAGWWAVGAEVNYASVGEQLAAEADPSFIPPDHRDLAGDLLVDHLARAHQAAFLVSEDPERLIAHHREQHAH